MSNEATKIVTKNGDLVLDILINSKQKQIIVSYTISL